MKTIIEPTKAQATPAPAIDGRLPVFTAETALSALWNRACVGMPQHERKWFAAGAANEVSRQTRQLSTVVEGIGCLVCADKNSGTFQDADSLTDLLFQISNQLSSIAGLASIAELAQFEWPRNGEPA